MSIPCRFHGFYIDKKMQKGAINGVFYLMAPKNIIHSWVEVMDLKQVTILEGFILDKVYMEGLLKTLTVEEKSLCGYGASTFDLPAALLPWDGQSDTYIQKESITQDLGVFKSPDEFFTKFGTNLTGIRRILYGLIIRRVMNRNVEKIRSL